MTNSWYVISETLLLFFFFHSAFEFLVFQSVLKRYLNVDVLVILCLEIWCNYALKQQWKIPSHVRDLSSATVGEDFVNKFYFFFKFQAVFENEEHKEAYVLLSDQLLINNTRNYFKHQCSNKTSECWWMSSKALELLMMCSARLGYLPRHRLHSFCRAVRTRRTFLGRQCIFSICFIDSFTVISYIQQLVNCALEQMFDS